MKIIGLPLLGLVSLVSMMLFTPSVAAQTQDTSTKPLPPETITQISSALNQLSITLGMLGVRMEQQQMILVGANQQLGVVANQLKVLENPTFLDTEAKRGVVSQIVNLDARVVGLIKNQVDLVSQERSTQISTLGQLTQKFQSLTQLVLQLRSST